jgi:hypothetical protein
MPGAQPIAYVSHLVGGNSVMILRPPAHIHMGAAFG